MVAEKNIREELLKQNGISAGTSPTISEKILARDAARVRRLRRITTAGWIVFLICLIMAAASAIIAPRSVLAPVAIIVVQGVFLICLFLTISLYVRSRTLTMRQLQARLASIEAYLRQMAEKEK